MKSRHFLLALLTVACCGCTAPRGLHAHEITAPPSSAYDVQIFVDGRRANVIHHKGRAYLEGKIGERYSVKVFNRTGRRVEAVISVDGRDVIDGGEADFVSKRGYLIDPYDSIEIDGFRLSDSNVAAFRFSKVKDSYAAKRGNARNVGVIGVAVFPERRYAPPPQPIAQPRKHRRPAWNSPRGGGWFGADDQSRLESEESPPETSAFNESKSKAPAADQLYDEGAGEGRALTGGKTARSERRRDNKYRQGLGTEFGERRWSPVRHVSFERADSNSPNQVLAIFYNDRKGLLAAGVPLHRRDPYRISQWKKANPFPESPRRNYAPPPKDWRYE